MKLAHALTLLLAVVLTATALPAGAETIAPDYVIDDDESLQHFADANYTTFDGDLTIQGPEIGSADLAELSGLQRIEGRLIIRSARNLTSLAGLSELRKVGGGVDLLGNESLTSLDGLENLTEIGADFTIAYHPRLEELGALTRLRSIGGALRIMGNARLATLDGLDSLERVSMLHLAYLPRLKRLAWPARLESIDGLSVEGNQRLESLEIPDCLESTAYLRVADNPVLAELVAAPGWRSEGQIELVHNGGLDRCKVNDWLTSIGIDADDDSRLTVEEIDEECER